MAADATTVNVKNIGPETTEAQVKDFFSFCGKISNLSLTKDGDHQTATVTFEKTTAAKTAMLLDNTQLGSSLVAVSSHAAPSTTDEPMSASPHSATTATEHVDQEDKPRARILAEYLASGYTVSDRAIESAIALDRQHGFSSKFTSALKNFDDRYKASEKAQGLDTRYGVTEKAGAGISGVHSYFEKALGTPTGQKIRTFYVDSHKQVMDVHNEARRLADLRAGKQQGGTTDTPTPTPATATATDSPAPGLASAPTSASAPASAAPPSGLTQVPGTDKTQCSCGGSTEACPCEPGKCACGDCPKNSGHGPTGDPSMIEKMGMRTVEGTEGRTRCNCAGDGGSCPCEPGKCACGSCGKNPDVTSPTPASA